ncbi:MAG TPA: LON peptidase substrate-binding domain-containing protein [Thermoleophilaceae bacterium]|nr:LON peptidase substrate-binding domain-containing protein [Thermoleophilaceae bacterium]
MPGDRLERFPLFPLGLVLLPQELVPLHIFEDRYKLMIEECLERDTEFGIVWLSDGGLRDIGCTARIERVIERFDDGRMNIIVVGERPFRLLRRIDDMPYPAGDVELLQDFDPAADPELAEQAHSRYAELVERATEEKPDVEEIAELDAYGMAATVEHPPEAKQALLELRAENDRLRMVEEMFRTAMKRVAYAEEAAERAQTNGSVPH